MNEQRRASQIVNNFFTLASIIIISIVLALYAKFGPKKEPPPRLNSGLACQELTYTFDKVYNQKLLNEGKMLLEKGSYILDGGLIKPRFGKSYLKDKITIEESNQFFVQSMAVQPLDNPAKFLTVKYEIIENDKNDPRKKDDSCKLHAGSLMTSFRINGKEAFRVHTDFLQYDKKEIQEKIACTVKAYKHNAK